MESRTYIAIDLKSFYASVECAERGLDPLRTHLVVADESRTDKTICLAVSPSLKAYGIPGRARLFEVKQRLQQVYKDTGGRVEFIIAPPRMALYMQYSRRVVDIYRQYVADEDIHVYSVDEVFMDVTHYLGSCYKMSAHELTIKMIRHVLRETGITATAGIGTNLYLAKVAMDIVAKHIPADEDGVRIAELDELSYRRQLWNHQPLTSFWRIGRGIAARLEAAGVDTMGKLARLSIVHGEWLYHQFGINAELLIDHAWGYEPCTIEAIKAYRPESNSLSSGQVLSRPYSVPEARTVVKEMADNMSLELFAKRLVTNQLVLTINYDTASLSDACTHYEGPVTTDHYGRTVPKAAHGSVNLSQYTSSAKEMITNTAELYDRIIDKNLLVRRITIAAMHVISESRAAEDSAAPAQLSLFLSEDEETKQEQQRRLRSKEKHLQQAMTNIKERYGKNALLRGLNYDKGATARERNQQIGGHKA